MGAAGLETAVPTLGAVAEDGGVRFTVWSEAAREISVCLFDRDDREIDRASLTRGEGNLHTAFVAGLEVGARYGLRAEGEYNPEKGLWFDPDKLLVDPYATEIDRPFRYDPLLGARRGEAGDTAALMPKAVVGGSLPVVSHQDPRWRDGGLIYELSVRAFTMRHPDIAPELRGTIAAMAEPPIIAHLKKLGVTAVELMPVAAWIDERHLPPLGLTNAWGYNPVTMMALDPRLAPGGIGELAATVDALHKADIGVILDVVFNHTGESDEFGPTLSLRGLDSRAYYRHVEDGGQLRLVNDTGTGNTLACDYPAVINLVLDSMRHFVRHAAIDGFRFDLAPILGRTGDGFDPNAQMLAQMTEDPHLGDRVLIAEPWDIGPGGYQLGNFPPPFLEWNDHARDDLRRFWRGDAGKIGALATRLAGSSEIFGDSGRKTRSVNFIAAHDGMTLADLTACAHKHNEANGEENRDGHSENLSWNNGVEGETDDAAVVEARVRDIRALLATLFVSRGAIMLTAGDEFGRTQNGNNNAYAQDNALTWLDWKGRDRSLEDHVAALSALRAGTPVLTETGFLSGSGDVQWLTPQGMKFSVADWENPENRQLCMLLGGAENGGRLAAMFNGGDDPVVFHLPDDAIWEPAIDGVGGEPVEDGYSVRARSVAFRREQTDKPANAKRRS